VVVVVVVRPDALHPVVVEWHVVLQEWEVGDVLDAGAGQITLQSETVWVLAQLLAELEDFVLDAVKVLSVLCF